MHPHEVPLETVQDPNCPPQLLHDVLHWLYSIANKWSTKAAFGAPLTEQTPNTHWISYVFAIATNPNLLPDDWRYLAVRCPREAWTNPSLSLWALETEFWAGLPLRDFHVVLAALPNDLRMLPISKTARDMYYMLKGCNEEQAAEFERVLGPLQEETLEQLNLVFDALGEEKSS